jgi:electron transfer flavoprotein alpha subunit
VIGVVVVREGRLAPGAAEVLAHSDESWAMGSGTESLDRVPAGVTRLIEIGPFEPGPWCEWLAHEGGAASFVLSAEPDGRDLAGRMGEVLDAPVYAGCLELSDARAVVPRYGSATTVVMDITGRFVATLQVRHGALEFDAPSPPVERVAASTHPAPRVELLAPDPTSVDLADSPRILAGGAGLDEASDFERLARVAPALGAAMGATRVITDRGWVPARHQIGTTGVTVDPALYVAFGISGAVQHTSGLGSPAHVISVNIDPACPMSQMADVAIVADAALTLAALEDLLGERA